MIKKYTLLFFIFLGALNFGFGQTFNQITSLAELTDGYYIVAESNEQYAMNNSHNGTYLARTAISPIGGSIINPNATIIWRIETNGSGRTIYSEDSSKYISYTGSSNNVQIVNTVTSNNQRWNVTYSGGNFIFSNSAITSRDLQYNASAPRFACYTGSQMDLVLYKLNTPAGPTITATPTTISDLDYSFGNGPSTEQSFDVEGTLLTADIDVTAPTNFEIATSTAGPYGNIVTIPALDANNTNTIYVRLAAGLPSNNYSGTITVSSTGATTENVSVNGEVTSSGSSCNELIISEYIEGSSNNKYIEIYNPTNSSINLANYRVAKYTNGSSTVSGTPPSLIGSIAPYSTYIIGNNNSGIYNLCDFINSYYDFNGNDVVSLQTSGGINIDVIGTIGNGSNFALDITLRRNSTIQEPNSTFSSSEWETHPQNTISDLGSHTSDCQGPTPELQLVDDASTNQNCGYTIDFGSQALSTNTNITFDIENVGSDDLDITSLGITGNYTVSPTGPMTISAGNSQTFTVTFTPTTNGTQNGTITINNNDPNEGTCTINLTGEGFTPAPEIDIERNTGGTIPNGSSPNIGYNTIFAATIMGDSSSPKTFHVSNEGTSDLDLTSITSSNPTEFSISLNPSPSTISSNTEVDFEIVFSPTGVGLRTSTITIISNDSDENPYTFQVQGNGDCAASPITISPMSGPEATIISITGNNFGSATTATLNGVSISSVNVISSTELELSVPSGATTGSLEITNDLGCLSSELFIVIDNQISSCEGNSGISPTELFISEVTDHGTGHHSYVEIFNGTGATVNLSGYEIRIHNNGASTATSSVPLSGSIINGDVFVLAFGQSDATDAHASHGFDQSSNVNGINEDDHIRLYNGTTWIDLWGDTSGDSFTIASKNYTYRRKNTGIIAPSTTWNSNDWDSFSPVDYTDIGTFDFSTGVPPSITSGPTINQSCNTATISVSAEEGYTGGNSLAFQWYYLAPGDSGWTEIMDDATFNNSDTAILEILDIFPVVDYQFYCQVRENDQTCFTASNAVLLELESVIWNGSSWSPIDPNSNTIAILNADYDTSISGSFEACNLIINDSALIIGDIINGGSNTYVEVQYSVYVNGNGSILVHPQAAFVQVNDDGVFEADNPDNCEVNKLTAPMAHWYEYTYWSSPTIETIGDALAEANPNRRFKFSGQDFRDSYEENANTNTFNPNPGIDDIDDDPNYISDGTGVDWQLMNASDDMLPGVGYASTHSTIGFNSFPCGGGPGCQFLYQFKGLFNNGVISVPVYRNDEEPDDNNWNFIGNPYPSAISADAFLEYNSDISSASNRVIDGALYLWSQNTDANGNVSGNQALNFSQSDYAIINGIGSTATSAGGDGSNPDNRMIPSGQGFFITMSDGALGTTFTSDPSSDAGDIQSKDVIFNNSMRVKGNSDNSQFFRNATQETNSMESITLSLTSDNGIFSQVVVGYKDGATDGLDYMYYDAPANSVSNNMTLAYFQIEDSNKKFAIQGKHPESLTLEEVIPMGFQTNIEEASIFNIEIAQLKGDFMLSHSIYIKDNFFNTYHDLTQSAYTFNSETGAFNDRFEIVFQTNALSTSESVLNTNDLSIVELQNGMVSFTVGENKIIEKVEIYDLLGRSLWTVKGSSSKEVLDLSSLSSSAYLAKITLNNGQEITKKAIKR